MTRKEAIELLVNATYSDEFQGNEDLTTAHNMAIEALKQKPCEDAISRQAVLAIAGDSCLDLNDYEDAKEFCDEINELPPVEHGCLHCQG